MVKPNQDAAAGDGHVLEKLCMTADRSRRLEWHSVFAAGMVVGCTGHLKVEAPRTGWRCTAGVVEEVEQCMETVLLDAEGGAAAAAVDCCSGSSSDCL